MTVRPSRPLRALAGVIGCYVVARSLVVWWPSDVVSIMATPAPPVVPIAAVPPRPAAMETAAADDMARPQSPIVRRALIVAPPPLPVASPVALVAAPPETRPARPSDLFAEAQGDPVLPPAAMLSRADRRPGASLSAWVFARGQGEAALGTGGQLGGPQVGVRGYLPLARGVALTGSVTSQIGARAGEASVGVALRRGALGLLVERRVRLTGSGRQAFAVTAVGGVSDVRVTQGVRLDAYAQAGVVGDDGFGDGAVTVERTVLKAAGSSIGIAAGAWGGAQPGVARLDIGPSIVARVPLGQTTGRIAFDWRMRVAGNARPGSGPALTLAANF